MRPPDEPTSDNVSQLSYWEPVLISTIGLSCFLKEHLLSVSKQAKSQHRASSHSTNSLSWCWTNSSPIWMGSALLREVRMKFTLLLGNLSCCYRRRDNHRKIRWQSKTLHWIISQMSMQQSLLYMHILNELMGFVCFRSALVHPSMIQAVTACSSLTTTFKLHLILQSWMNNWIKLFIYLIIIFLCIF